MAASREGEKKVKFVVVHDGVKCGEGAQEDEERRGLGRGGDFSAKETSRRVVIGCPRREEGESSFGSVGGEKGREKPGYDLFKGVREKLSQGQFLS